MYSIIECQNGCQIIVGTPGRILDMVDRGALKVEQLKLFILDEIDEMLSRGFKEQIHDLYSYLPTNNTNTCQIVSFSSKISNEILTFTSTIMKKDGLRIETTKSNDLRLDGIKQYYISVEKEEYKLATLIDIFESCYFGAGSVIIFCNTRRKCKWLTEKLIEKEFKGIVCLFVLNITI